MPFDIVGLNRSDLLTNGDLSKYVTIVRDSLFNVKQIKFVNSQQADAISIDEFFLEPLLNHQLIKIYD